MAKKLTKAQERILALKRQEQVINNQLISDAEELVDLGGSLTKIQQAHINNLKIDKALTGNTVDLEKELIKQMQSGNILKSKQAQLAKAQLDSLKHSLKTGKITTDQFKSQSQILEQIDNCLVTEADESGTYQFRGIIDAIISPHLNANYDPSDLIGFVAVESAFYSELTEYYQAKINKISFSISLYAQNNLSTFLSTN